MNEKEQKQLEQLNKEVTEAIEKRRKWLDDKMEKYAIVKPGEDIYNLATGERLGIVSELYRFHRDRDDGVRDTSLDINYQFCTGGNCYDNTSRQYVVVGDKRAAADRLQAKAIALR